MVNSVYNFKNFDYQSTAEFVSVKIDYTLTKDSFLQKRIWNWKGTHNAAKSLGLDSNSGEAFSGKDITVILGINTTGEKIPIQVCTALEEIERNLLEPKEIQKSESRESTEETKTNPE